MYRLSGCKEQGQEEEYGMKYYILKHTDLSKVAKDGKVHAPWICRVVVQDHQANVLNRIFEDYVVTGCYGEYKGLAMTKEQFDKGTVTKVLTLEQLPKFIHGLGYVPY